MRSRDMSAKRSQRYLRLEQTYLHIADAEDQLVGQISALAGSETKPAA